jgi:hypothetical protein
MCGFNDTPRCFPSSCNARKFDGADNEAIYRHVRLVLILPKMGSIVEMHIEGSFIAKDGLSSSVHPVEERVRPSIKSRL